MLIYYHVTYICVFFSNNRGHFILDGDKKAKFVTKSCTKENLRPLNLMMGYDSFLQHRSRSTGQQNVAHPHDEIELENQGKRQLSSSPIIIINGNTTVEDELYKESLVSSSVGSTISLMDKNLNKENDKSLNLIPSSTQRKSPTSSSRPAKYPKRKNHQTPVEHKTKITPTEIDESYFSCSSPTTKKFKVYSNDSIIKTKQAKDNDPSEDSPIRIIQTRKTRKTKEALKSNHTEKKLERDFKAKNFGNDAYWTSKHANDTITKVVETVTASLTKRQKLKIKKRNRINSSKKHQRYISALNGNISPPSDADELGKKYYW